jgi:hypothetical protein
MRILGIDPGKQGAFALFDTIEHVVETYDMPDTIDGRRELLSEIGAVHVAWVERPFYPHKIGVRHVATIAEGFGILQACLSFAGVPTRLVDPHAWKKSMRLSSDKAASRQLASLTWPDCADQWKLAKHDGRAEAALIALYGWSKR